MQETWKPVSSWVGLYEVSSLGRVRSLDRIANRKGGFKSFHRGKILKPMPDKDGYMTVCLVARPIIAKSKIHRLVALHFLPSSDLPEVNHKDLDKTNNVPSNLEWTDRQRNHEHAKNAGVFKAALNPRRARKITVEKCAAVVSAHRAGETYDRICVNFDIAYRTVSRIVAGKFLPTP